MPEAARKSVDKAVGPILTGSDNVNIEGMSAARKGDTVQAHGKPPHSVVTISEGSSKVNINGIPAARKGDAASCKHVIDSGSSKVNIG